MSNSEWQEVSRDEPCPICNKPDYCRRSPDGNQIACRRESRGAKKTLSYSDGSEAYLHVLRDDRTANRKGKPDRGTTKRANTAKAKRADAETIDRVYQRLLGALVLSPAHQKALQNRGLKDSVIESGAYRTLPDNTGPTIRTLRADFGDDVLLSVPGLLKTKVAAPPGLLIPVRGVSGQIIALKLRRDEATSSGRYLYLSSSKYHGPGPGSPAHVPTGITGPCDVARITEGEFKADVATALSGIPTISFPGVSSWRQVLPVLKALQVKTVRLAFDADAMENENVARCLLESFQALAGDGFAVELERWDAANGKGIDDLLAAGGKPEVLVGDAALQAAREIAKAAGVEDKQTVVDEISNRIDELLSDGPGAIYSDKQLLQRLAQVAVNDPPAYAAIREKLRTGGVRLRDFDRAIKQLIEEAVRQQPADFARGETGGFFTSDGCLCRTKFTAFQPITVPLCNFTASIVDETVRDDGAESRVMLGITGKLASGKPLRRIEVAGESFARLDWIVPNWGSDAIVWPNESRAVPAAIQALSGKKQRRTVFCHTGWREISGCWVYLHAGGAIGLPKLDATVSVDLQPPLEKYALPNLANQIDAIRACLRLLELGPHRLMFPVLAATFRAAIGSVDFAVHLAGASGVFKSELAALAQQHFGPELDARNLPGNWSSTGNSLEYAAFLAKDAIFVVDDFAPSGSTGDVQRLHREADRLLRAQGNHSGRQRMTRDGQLRPAKPPRGLILSTGEDVPRGQSLRARLLILDVSAGDIDPARLTDCQHDAASGLYAQTMAGFISRLAPRYQATQEQLPSKLAEYRAKATSNGQHARTPGIVAQLAIGWHLFLRFATSTGAISEGECETLFERGWRAFIDAANAQADQQAANEPAAHFIRLLTAAIATGKAHVADMDGGKPDAAESWGWRSGLGGGDLLGWLDGDHLYLEPETSFAAVQRLAGAQNEAIGVTPTTLRKRLHERGYLAETDANRQTLTVRKTIGGKRREVLSLRADTIGTKPDQPDQSVPTGDGGDSYSGQVGSHDPTNDPTSGQVFPSGGQVESEDPTNGTHDEITTSDELVESVGFSTGEEAEMNKKQTVSDEREQFDI